MSTTLVSQSPILTLEQVKLWVRVRHNQENSLLEDLLAAATEFVEHETGQVFSNGAVYTTTFDTFSNELELPAMPAQGITSIVFKDANNAPQTLSASVYELDAAARPGVVRLKPNQSWPSTNGAANNIVVTYTVGPVNAPARAKQAIKFLCETWYDNRDIGKLSAEEQNQFRRLIWSLKYPRFA